MNDNSVRFKTYLHILLGVTITALIAEMVYVIVKLTFQLDGGGEMKTVIINRCLLPSVVNVAICIAEYNILGNPNIKKPHKEISTFSAFILMVLSLSLFHHEHVEVCAAYALVIMSAAVYGKKCYVRLATRISLVASLIHYSIVTAIIINKEKDDYSGNVVFTLMSMLICLFLIITAYVMSELIRKTIEHAGEEIASQINNQMSLEEKSKIDGMTGLYNHTAFYDLLDREIKKADREGTALSIAAIDVDNFKSVNDTYGHSNGDEVLIMLAAILKNVCKDYIVCRYGGEEFSVIFPGLKSDKASDYMEQALEIIREVKFEWCDHAITFSCGVCQFYDIRVTAEDLFMQADRYLYKAKRSGKNRVVSDKTPSGQ